jgi:RHS repeat-associated protein
MPVTHYLWDEVNDTLLAETDEAGNTIAQYTHEPGRFGPLISQRRNGHTYYHHYDGQGSTRALTDESGNVTDRYTYDAWGNEVAHSGTTANPFRWVGQVGYYFDDDWQTFYVRARMYESTVSRWMSRDPLSYRTGTAARMRGPKRDPDTGLYHFPHRYYQGLFSGSLKRHPTAYESGDLNFYAYVGASPPDRYDPSGLKYCGHKCCCVGEPVVRQLGWARVKHPLGTFIGWVWAADVTTKGTRDCTFASSLRYDSKITVTYHGTAREYPKPGWPWQTWIHDGSCRYAWWGSDLKKLECRSNYDKSDCRGSMTYRDGPGFYFPVKGDDLCVELDLKFLLVCNNGGSTLSELGVEWTHTELDIKRKICVTHAADGTITAEEIFPNAGKVDLLEVDVNNDEPWVGRKGS